MRSGSSPVFSAIEVESVANSSLTFVILMLFSLVAKLGGTFLKFSSFVCPVTLGFSLFLFSSCSRVFLILDRSVACFFTLSVFFSVSFSMPCNAFFCFVRLSATSFLVSSRFKLILWNASSFSFSESSSFLKNPIWVFSIMLELAARVSSTLAILCRSDGSSGSPR